MAGQTQSQSQVMESTAKKFEEVNTGLQTMLTTLMNELSAVSGGWAGRGAVAFEQVREQYAADLRKINQALQMTAESIRQSGVAYSASDEESASQVTNAAGGGVSLPL